MQAAEQLLEPLGVHERTSAPASLLRLAYPAPFSGETTSAAGAEHVPPLLLLALVRQESAFDPEAGSIAGALGLTQVVPATGEEIAEALGVPWSPQLMFEPKYSLRFGAHYLSQQLDLFEGEIASALAAYKGGPGNALRWEERQRFPDAEGFIDAIEFTETRRYVELVLENYAWYRYLYAGVDAPALP